MTETTPSSKPDGWLTRAADSDILHSFLASKVTVLAALVALTFFIGAAFAPLIAPHNPFDLASIDLLDSLLPPAWAPDGNSRFLLGTGDLGRDIFSTILYGARISIGVGVVSVAFAATLGIALGLIAGYAGGRIDAFIMRVAEVQLTFPAILIALLVDCAARGIFGNPNREHSAF